MTIDPEAAKNAVIVGAGAYLAKDLLKQALGPTADYIGDGLKTFTAKRVENIDRILHKFINKLGQRINEPGQVHPKLLKGLISDGSFCDDELTAEYYGGVMASSRTGISQDDRGASYLHQISLLSTYQIRTHFIFYTVLQKLFQGRDLDPRVTLGAYDMATFISVSEYYRSMAFKEVGEYELAVCSHSFVGLEGNNLVSSIRTNDPTMSTKILELCVVDEDGIIFKPSRLGMELYLWATGNGNVGLQEFLNPEIKFFIPEGIEIPTNALSIAEEIKKLQR